MQKYLIFWLFFLGKVQAIIMSDVPKHSLRLGIESLSVQQPGRDFQARSSYFLSGHVSIWDNWRWDLLGIMAPDKLKRSKSVDIRHDYAGVFSGVSFVFSYLFRYALGCGAGVWFQNIKGKLYEEEYVSEKRDLAYFGRLNIDYAVLDWFEVGTYFSLFYRYDRGMFDRSYGVSLNFSFG